MWYNEAGFAENPFDDSPDKRLVGYEKILNDVTYNINAGNIIFLEGKNGFGKTSILKRATQQFMGFGRVAYIECNKIKELNIENVLTGKYSWTERLFNKYPRGMIVLIDDVQELDKKNTERLKYFYDQDYIKAIVFAGENYNKLNFSESLKDRVKNVIKLPLLNDYEAVDLINSRLDGKELIPADVAKEIFERVDKNPGEFLRICGELCKNAVEMKEEKVMIEHVNNVLPGKKGISAKKDVEKSKKANEKPKNIVKKKEEGSQELKIIYEKEDIAEKYY